MMKTLTCFFAVAATAFFSSVPETANAQNLLVNPGFEANVLNPLNDVGGATGWSAFGDAFTRFQSPRSGNNALKAFGDGGVFQDFAAVEGTSYSGEVFGLNPNFDPFTGGMIGAVNIEFRNASGDLIGDILTNPFLNVNSPAGDSEGGTMPDVYSLGTVSGVAPAGATSVRFALFAGGGGGAAYFDDASFGVTTAIPEPTSIALLGLAGFGVMARRRRSC